MKSVIERARRTRAACADLHTIRTRTFLSDNNVNERTAARDEARGGKNRTLRLYCVFVNMVAALATPSPGLTQAVRRSWERGRPVRSF